ncbi:hypothetical protein Tco_0645288 [Tanacetum coccineum]
MPVGHNLKRLYYCKTSTTLFLGIKELLSGIDVEDMFNAGYDNGNMMNLFVEDYDYDVMACIDLEPSLKQNIEDSDCYSSDDYEEIDNVDFQNEADDKENLDNDPIDPAFKVKKGMNYLSFGPTIPLDKMEPVLGIRYVMSKKGKKDKVMPNTDRYVEALMEKASYFRLNPGTTCRLDVDQSNGSPTFKRIYICFKGVKDGWLAGCRKAIDSILLGRQHHTKYKEKARGTKGETKGWILRAEYRRHWIVYPISFQELEVRKGDDSFGVNLLNKVSIKPVIGSKYWKKTNDVPPSPPLYRKRTGRPQKQRIKCPIENNSTKSVGGFAAALAVLVTGASQSRQHESHHRFFPVDTSLIHIESRKSPTKSLFDVGSRRISIFTVNTKEYHSDVLAIITRIMRRT